MLVGAIWEKKEKRERLLKKYIYICMRKGHFYIAEHVEQASLVRKKPIELFFHNS